MTNDLVNAENSSRTDAEERAVSPVEQSVKLLENLVQVLDVAIFPGALFPQVGLAREFARGLLQEGRKALEAQGAQDDKEGDR